MPATTAPLPAALVARVLERLGIERPPATLAGLATLYGAWCRAVPFDNVRKLIHIRAGNPARLPGDESTDFFDAWLRYGTGGTCWAGNGALFDMVTALGFDARCAVSTMEVRPGIPPNHGTVIVHLDGERWLVDASILFGEPLRLDPQATTAVRHPAWGVQCRPDRGTWTLHWRPIGIGTELDCHLNEVDVPRATFYELHEGTRAWSGFNYELTARLNRDDRVFGAGFGQFVVLDAHGGLTKRPASQAERIALLRDEIGIAAEIVERLPADVPTPPPPGSATAAAAAAAAAASAADGGR
jgi:N-hydroxyarylamine O-acetyltransferase